MTLITDRALSGSKLGVPNSEVTARLDGVDAGRVPAGLILASEQTRSAADGSWSLDLAANSEITPAGTAWRITVRGGGFNVSRSYVVPVSVTPVPVADLTIVDAPGSPVSAALSVHQVLRGPGGHLPDGGVSGDVVQQIAGADAAWVAPDSLGFASDRRNGVTIGVTSLVGGVVTVDADSPWGIDVNGVAYWDPAGAAPGEGAVLSLEGDGSYRLTPLVGGGGGVQVGGGLGYRHTQTVAAAQWTITHGLGFQPGGVTVTDGTGAAVLPEVVYPDALTVALVFAAPTSGVARIS